MIGPHLSRVLTGIFGIDAYSCRTDPTLESELLSHPVQSILLLLNPYTGDARFFQLILKFRKAIVHATCNLVEHLQEQLTLRLALWHEPFCLTF